MDHESNHEKACATPASSARAEPTNGGGSDEGQGCVFTAGCASRPLDFLRSASFLGDERGERAQGRSRGASASTAFPEYAAR